jgi:predicted alpha-1,2-mannosidase
MYPLLVACALLCMSNAVMASSNTLPSAVTSSSRHTKYVDPFIGTQGDGNVFPGASLPFGMVKLGPDCGDLNSNMGYRHDGKVKGFSHLHVSGTGGGPKYGNILLYPFTGEINLADYGALRTSEAASPGYYTASFDNGITAELTVSPHAGVHRYSYPRGAGKMTGDDRKILIDAGSILGQNACCGEQQNLLGSEIEILSDTEVAGFNRISGGWNMGEPFTVYFYVKFDTPSTSCGTWKADFVQPGKRSEFDSGEAVGAWMNFGPGENPVEARVGISFKSVGKARQNCIDDTSGLTFEAIQEKAVCQWEDILSRVEVKSDSADELVKFYTALYHCYLQPVDKTGENSRWNSVAPYYDDFYCIWDTFRTLHPLMTMLTPDREAAIVNSLIDIYRHEGYMPDGRSGDSNGRTQGGSNGDMLVAEAILKELSGIDVASAIEAMLKDGEVDPGSEARKHGRGGITDYKKLGYVSTDFERGGTRTLEYSANDFAIALAADKLGLDSIAQVYYKRSGNWENLWRDVECDGETGFIMPRKSNGDWDDDYCEPTWEFYVSTPPHSLGIIPHSQIASEDRHSEKFTPRTHGSWPNFFYETNSWEDSFYVPHDVARLIGKVGGSEKFVKRVDKFFDNGYFNINNEPGFLIPYLYLYAGRPDKTAECVDNLLTTHYRATPDGLPGNDDSGSMSSWYIFNTLGFFPNAGQDIYLLTAPRFSEATLTLPQGSPLRIEAENLSPENIYVQAIEWNGEPWNQLWFTHSDLLKGGVLRFKMGSEPSRQTFRLPPSGY